MNKGKPVYLTCQVGLRGYLAARILMQHGFDSYNLSGGYRLYNSIFRVSSPKTGVKINTETQKPEKG